MELADQGKGESRKFRSTVAELADYGKRRSMWQGWKRQIMENADQCGKVGKGRLWKGRIMPPGVEMADYGKGGLCCQGWKWRMMEKADQTPQSWKRQIKQNKFVANSV